MTTYNTGNPIGSTDSRDRLDNTENMDYLENSTTELTHPDRLGTVRKTRHGMEVQHDAQIAAHESEHDAQISAHEAEHDNQMQSFENDFDSRLAGMAFTRVGSFTTGATITDMRQVLIWEVSQGGDGHEYGWAGTFPKVVAARATPATSGGIGPGAWVDQSDLTLRSQLASSSGGVSLVNGAATQTQVDNLQERSDVYAYIEDYDSLVVSDDYTAAIQAALDTGKDVIGIKGKTYKTSAILNSQGQRIVGTIKLQISRSTTTAATFEIEPLPPKTDHFRAIYVQSAYDLCDLLRIKSMGFNTLLHYCCFDNDAADVAGTIPKLIKNAQTAGLNLVINTQNSVSHNNGTVAQVVAAADTYENVIGYSVIDEPGSAGSSLATQEAAISTLRALTKKKLYSVDFVWRLNTWTQPWSYNFDVFLVDSYSMFYSSGTAANKLDRDLGKMRTDFGAVMKMTGQAKVIPCFQAYAQPEPSPVEGISGSYASDISQITSASRVFGKVGNGDFACFVWDGGMTSNVRNTTAFQDVVKEIINHAGKGEVYKTEPIIFGGVGSVYQRTLHDIMSEVVVKDPENSTDAWLGGGAWPVRLATGSSESPIRTTTANIDIAGIGFRNPFSRLVTKKSLLKYFTGFAVFENYGTAFTQPASFDVYSTQDGGYTQTVRYTTAVTAGTPFRFSSLMTHSFDGIGEDAVFAVSIATADAMSNYRRFVYGLFVSTNW